MKRWGYEPPEVRIVTHGFVDLVMAGWAQYPSLLSTISRPFEPPSLSDWRADMARARINRPDAACNSVFIDVVTRSSSVRLRGQR